MCMHVSIYPCIYYTCTHNTYLFARKRVLFFSGLFFKVPTAGTEARSQKFSPGLHVGRGTQSLSLLCLPLSFYINRKLALGSGVESVPDNLKCDGGVLIAGPDTHLDNTHILVNSRSNSIL